MSNKQSSSRGSRFSNSESTSYVASKQMRSESAQLKQNQAQTSASTNYFETVQNIIYDNKYIIGVVVLVVVMYFAYTYYDQNKEKFAVLTNTQPATLKNSKPKQLSNDDADNDENDGYDENDVNDGYDENDVYYENEENNNEYNEDNYVNDDADNDENEYDNNEYEEE